ncbi:MAG: hypothetical protein Tsb0014_25020 [Pleurocapsa sp.]
MALNTTNGTNLTPQEIANLLVGVGVKIIDDTVAITGSDSAIGEFTGGLSEDIGIDSGVILSTGNIADASGPNDSDSTGQGLGEPGDEDLNILLGARADNRDDDNSDNSDNNNGDTSTTKGTNDAVVLEFDFVPESEEFIFEYVFASEEYNEFANSTFNDIFAFLLEEENIALIPGTSTEVSINSINASENSSFYRNNDFSDIGVNNLLRTEFDGLTNTLAVRGFVTPEKRHHLKLAIADTGDSIFDSAVFLKGGSLSTPLQTDNASLSFNERDILTIDSPEDPAFVRLKFGLSETNTDSINEVGVFVVDDELGRINGILPGEPGYEQLALGGVQSRAIFTGLENSPLSPEALTRLLKFDVGSKLGFYLVTDGTSDIALSDTPQYFYQPKPQVLFSFPQENPDGNDPLQVKQDGDIFTLAWDDDSNDNDYDDMVLTVEVSDPAQSDLLDLSARRQGDVQKEIIDLSILEDGESVTANIEIAGDSLFSNTVGLYRMEDGQGTVVDPVSGAEFKPEDSGYAAAAIAQRVFEFSEDGGGEVELEQGFYAPYMIVDSTAEEWLVKNPTNFPHFDSFAYSPFMAADGSDFKYEHLALLGDNTFGFEDRRIAVSDFDFDDIVMHVDF